MWFDLIWFLLLWQETCWLHSSYRASVERALDASDVYFSTVITGFLETSRVCRYIWDNNECTIITKPVGGRGVVSRDELHEVAGEVVTATGWPLWSTVVNELYATGSTKSKTSHCKVVIKKRSARRKHCALAAVRRSQKCSPRRRPNSR